MQIHGPASVSSGIQPTCWSAGANAPRGQGGRRHHRRRRRHGGHRSATSELWRAPWPSLVRPASASPSASAASSTASPRPMSAKLSAETASTVTRDQHAAADPWSRRALKCSQQARTDMMHHEPDAVLVGNKFRACGRPRTMMRSLLSSCFVVFHRDGNLTGCPIRAAAKRPAAA